MLVIQMIQFSSISSKKNQTSETTKEIEQGPNQKRKSLTYFHQNQLPAFSCNPPPHFWGERKPSVPILKNASSNCRAAPRPSSQAEAGTAPGAPGFSAEASALSRPTSACQPGAFRVVTWRRACLVRWSLRMKRRSHAGHANFFSPV